MVDSMEQAEEKGHIIFLDWAKAFDKVQHVELFNAMERYNISKDSIAMVKALYQNPTFTVKLNGKISNPKVQTNGIRQGCPLSPS
jgi:replication-associated recombination protein RarA